LVLDSHTIITESITAITKGETWEY
jgi:hypothetical protein